MIPEPGVEASPSDLSDSDLRDFRVLGVLLILHKFSHMACEDTLAVQSSSTSPSLSSFRPSVPLFKSSILAAQPGTRKRTHGHGPLRVPRELMCATRRSLSAETQSLPILLNRLISTVTNRGLPFGRQLPSDRGASFTVVFAFPAPESYSTVPHCFTVPYAWSLAGKVSRYMFEPGELINGTFRPLDPARRSPLRRRDIA